MNINLVITNLPTSINALAKLNDDDSYTILVNKRLCQAKMVSAIRHELKHIINDDFHMDSHVNLIERMVELNSEPNLEDFTFFVHYA